MPVKRFKKTSAPKPLDLFRYTKDQKYVLRTKQIAPLKAEQNSALSDKPQENIGQM